jgi:hypothetical protein
MKSLHHSGSPIAFGRYEGLIEQPSTKIWDGNGGLLSARRTKRKTWLFIGAGNPELFIGFAIVDAGLVSKAFAYIYDLKNNILTEESITVPLGFGKDFDPNLLSNWKLKNFSISTEGNIMTCAYKGAKFALKLEVSLNDNGLSFMCPSKGDRLFHYTYKNLLLPTKASWTIGGKEFHMHNLKGGIDFSKGYPPRHTTWNWTSFMGTTEDGISVGINVVDKFNDNLENVMWIGDEKISLGKMLYDYQPPLESSKWEVNAVDGNLQLMMQPLGARKENLNVLLLKSKFTQVYGPIMGKIKHNGVEKMLNGFGVMEEHEALW